ncbi:hypothetical protein LCGC14_2987760, partial [marine sediment metagenome]
DGTSGDGNNLFNASIEGVNKFVIDRTGNVGIGTTNPGAKLEVNGDVHIDGDLFFETDGSGLPYGEIYVNDNTTVSSVSNAGFTQFLHFDTNGHSNLSTPSYTDSHITIDKAGVYMVDCCVNIKNSSGAAHVVEAVIAKNDGTTIFPNTRRHRTLGTGTDVGAIPMCGHLDLAVNDTVEVWITSNSASSRNVIGEDVAQM